MKQVKLTKKEQKKLLLKVADYIVKHPHEYNQNDFCGTACCVGTCGWRFDKGIVRFDDTATIQEIASELLGFDGLNDYGELFASAHSWASPYDEMFYGADTLLARAKVAAGYIKKVIIPHYYKNVK